MIINAYEKEGMLWLELHKNQGLEPYNGTATVTMSGYQ